MTGNISVPDLDIRKCLGLLFDIDNEFLEEAIAQQLSVHYDSDIELDLVGTVDVLIGLLTKYNEECKENPDIINLTKEFIRAFNSADSYSVRFAISDNYPYLHELIQQTIEDFVNPASSTTHIYSLYMDILESALKGKTMIRIHNEKDYDAPYDSADYDKHLDILNEIRDHAYYINKLLKHQLPELKKFIHDNEFFTMDEYLDDQFYRDDIKKIIENQKAELITNTIMGEDQLTKDVSTTLLKERIDFDKLEFEVLREILVKFGLDDELDTHWKDWVSSKEKAFDALLKEIEIQIKNE